MKRRADAGRSPRLRRWEQNDLLRPKHRAKRRHVDGGFHDGDQRADAQSGLSLSALGDESARVADDGPRSGGGDKLLRRDRGREIPTDEAPGELAREIARAAPQEGGANPAHAEGRGIAVIAARRAPMTTRRIAVLAALSMTGHGRASFAV